MPQVSNRTGETLLLHNKHRLGVCPCKQMIMRQRHKGEIMQYETTVARDHTLDLSQLIARRPCMPRSTLQPGGDLGGGQAHAGAQGARAGRLYRGILERLLEHYQAGHPGCF